MSRLDELKKSLGDMNHDELLAKIREVRSDRKISKRVQRTTTKKARAKTKDKAADLLKGMSKEELKQILAQMGDK